MAWQAETIQVAIISGVGTCVFAGARCWWSCLQRRRLPDRWRLFSGVCSVALLGFLGGAVAGVIASKQLKGEPEFAAAVGVLLGISADWTVAAGPLRMLSLAMQISSRALESMRQSIEERQKSKPDDENYSDSEQER